MLIVVRISRVNGLVLFCCNIEAIAIISCIIKLHHFKLQALCQLFVCLESLETVSTYPRFRLGLSTLSLEGLGPIHANY